MKVIETNIAGVLIIEPKVFGDSRGFFLETFHADRYAEYGIESNFVQDNYSRSTKGVLRGLHCQKNYPQGKLVSVTSGIVFDVAVDIRKGSATFGQWVGETLSFENGKQLLIPTGFLHGFMTLVPDTEIVYKCTDYYAPQCDGAVRWDDADIAIEWPDVAGPVSLSDKDAKAVSFSDFTSPFGNGEAKA